MQAKEYDKIANELLNEAHEIEVSKRPAYTIGSSDVFQNFKSIAARTNQTPLQILCTYWLKHVDAITAFFSNPDIHQAEPIRSRFADCINYLKLGYALSEELRREKVDSDLIDEAVRYVRETSGPKPGDLYVRYHADLLYHFLVKQVVGDEICGITTVREVGVDIKDAEMYIDDTISFDALQTGWSKVDDSKYLISCIEKLAATREHIQS